MMDYPDYLPVPLQQGHRVQTVSPLIRSQLATGRARQRRAYTSVPQTVTVEWVMTTGQSRLFEAWFRWAINDGADWREMPVKTSFGCQREMVRFTDVYEGPIMVNAFRMRYRAEVEIFERRTLTAEDLEFPDPILYSDIIDIALNREWPEA